jgi:prepilin-type processing-associated H-X9-DG protein/prepilin-type N-terminal cleavage/methylation domain-containing protein
VKIPVMGRFRLNFLRCRAFTMIELLVVVAIIGLLSGLLLPALSQGKTRAQAATCRKNAQQIAYAFLMYLDDNTDIFPTAAARSTLGAQPEDWIWWQTEKSGSGTSAMRNPARGSVVQHLGNYDTRYFRCPTDKYAVKREIAWRENPGSEQFFYSYSLNAHSDHGMASYISRDRAMVFLNRISAVRNPSSKIMLAEEKGGPSDGPGSASIDDGRWVPPGYPLSVRHSGRANVAFADGHVESVRRDFADSANPEHYAPDL